MRRALVLLSLPLLVLFLWAVPAAASADGRTVLLIGDSIAQSISDDARTSFDGWNVITLGVGGTGLTHGTPAWQMGATFDWQTQLAEMDAQYDPDVVVIVLGTNDVFSVEQGEDYNPQVARLLSATDAPRVYWADIASHTADPLRNYAATQINAALAAEDREGFEVVPYDEQVSRDPVNLWEDGLHLSTTGQAAFAGLIDRYVGPASK